MVVGPGPAELVDHRQVRLDIVRDAVGEQHLVDRPVRAALTAGAVSDTRITSGVFALPGLLQVVKQPADVMVGVSQEPSVHLGHPREQPLLLADSESHGRVTSSGGNGWPLGPLRVSGVPIGLTGGSSVSAGTMPICFCRARVLLSHRLVPHVEAPLNLSAHSFETWCGACAAPGA